MPREQINYPHIPTSGEEDQHIDPILHVCWGSDTTRPNVQIVMELDSRWLAAAVEKSVEANYIGFYTPSLSRDEVNKLIKHLRRARDHAYGKDQ